MEAWRVGVSDGWGHGLVERRSSSEKPVCSQGKPADSPAMVAACPSVTDKCLCLRFLVFDYLLVENI